jgi:2-isopropylmalate synthase
MDGRERVRIFDTTLRDGEQAPGFSMTPAEKVRLAEQLERLGVDIIEAGFPVSSDGDFEAVRAVAGTVRTPIVAGLARAVPGDIDRAWAALSVARRPRIHVFLATSDLHLDHKLRIDRATCLARTRESVAYAKSLTADVEFSAEDATRSDLAFLCDVAAVATEAGATTINLPDTVGYALPADITRMFTAVKQRVGNDVTLSAHCHNDLGLAVANSIAAVQAGARQVECINGIGGGGNAASGVVMTERAARGAAFATTSQPRGWLTRLCGHWASTSRNKPSSAAVARSSASARTQSNELACEIMRPESVGAAGTRLVLRKHSAYAASTRVPRAGPGPK